MSKTGKRSRDDFLDTVLHTRNGIALADQQADRNAGPQDHKQRPNRKDRQEERRRNRDIARGRCPSSEEED